MEQVWYNALRGQKTARAGGGLPAPLSEVAGKQEVLVRHVVEHMADVCPVVQTFDAPVPQTVDQLVTALSHVDSFVPEQVIEVPKFFVASLSSSHGSQGAADGGTAGGSADGLVLFFVFAADCGTDR